MFYVGIIDVVCLFVNGLATGIFMINGYVFCSSPVLLQSSGSLGLGLWIAACDVGMILGINRCFEMYNTHVACSLFDDRKVYLWLMIPTFHGFCAWLFSKPVFFNSFFMSWFFNPHIGYYPDDELVTLIQVFCICTFTTIAAGVYVYEQFFPVSNIFILIGSYAWICAHGFPSVIYVTMNRTVRKQFLRLLQRKTPAIYSSNVQPSQTTNNKVSNKA
uniref:7TM GPCR serpentine receptor class x (Srx) domain-containing protein n=1 Tax=Panagrolaimus davidi TaxID=227884 RepID=A0A914PA48_9BILA